MSSKLYFNPFIPAFSNTGVAVASSKLYFFLTNTLTPAPVWANAEMTVPLPNPVQADLSGKFPPIYLDDSVVYRVRQTDKNDVPLGDDVDPYIPGQAMKGDPGGNSTAIGTFVQAPTLTIPTGVDMVHVSGYSVVGDGGTGARYVFDPTVNPAFVAANPRSSFMSANGRGFRLIRSQPLYVGFFGARGDGVTSDTDAIQAAIDFLGFSGGELIVGVGRHILTQSGSDNWCLRMRYPIIFRGLGANVSALVPAASVPNTVSTIRIEPDPAFNTQYFTIRDLFIGDPNTGTRRGMHAVHLRTMQSGIVIRQFQMHRCFIGNPVGPIFGRAFYHQNDAALNPDGALYDAEISGCEMSGGIFLENSGDSIRIYNNLLTGPNVGIYALLVNGPNGPASLLSILDNNITSTGGAIRLESSPRTHIERNNIEHTAPGAVAANGGAVIYVAGGTNIIAGGRISSNLVANLGTSDATSLIRVGNANSYFIENNYLLTGLPGLKAITIDTTGGPTNLQIRANVYSPGLPAGDRVFNGATAGTGVVGVKRTLTLLNGWENVPGEIPAFFSKDASGWVDVVLNIRNGTANTIGNLPNGYRPELPERFGPFRVLKSGVYYDVTLVVDSAGTITTSDSTKNDLLIARLRFRDVNGSDGTSSV